MEIQKYAQFNDFSNPIQAKNKLTDHLGYFQREHVINSKIVESGARTAKDILLDRNISTVAVSTQTKASEQEPALTKAMHETKTGTPGQSAEHHITPLTVHPVDRLNPVNDWTQILPPPVQTAPIADIKGRANHFFNKLENLTSRLLTQDCFYNADSSCLFMWHLKKCGPAEARHYSHPLVDIFHKTLSLMFEQQLYRNIHWHSDRESFLNILRDNVSKSRSLNAQHRKLLKDFISNAKQTDQVLFDLSCQLKDSSLIKQHHDEFFGFILEQSHIAMGRHCHDNSPWSEKGVYSSLGHKMMTLNALTYALTTDLSHGLKKEYIFDIITKLGHPRYLSDDTKLAVTLPADKSIKVTGLKELVKASVFTYKTDVQLDRTIAFIRQQITSNDRILFATHQYAKRMVLQDPELALLSTFIVNGDKLFRMRSLLNQQNRDRQLQGIVDTFDNTLRNIQGQNDQLSEEEIVRQLRHLVIETTRNILLVQPFPSGNKEMAAVLNILLCRLAGIQHVNINIDDYILYSVDEIYQRQVDLINPDLTIPETPKTEDDQVATVQTIKSKVDTEHLSNHPLAPIIASKCPALLDAILEAGLTDLLHQNIHHTAPLLYACLCSNEATVKILIKHGAKIEQESCLPNQRGSAKMTALQAVLRHQPDPKMIQALIEAGAKTDHLVAELKQLHLKTHDNLSFRQFLKNHLQEKKTIKQEKPSCMARLLQISQDAENDTDRELHALLKSHMKPAEEKAQKGQLMIRLYNALEKSEDASDQQLRESLRTQFLDHIHST